jgi:hypothetical protein
MALLSKPQISSRFPPLRPNSHLWLRTFAYLCVHLIYLCVHLCMSGGMSFSYIPSLYDYHTTPIVGHGSPIKAQISSQFPPLPPNLHPRPCTLAHLWYPIQSSSIHAQCCIFHGSLATHSHPGSQPQFPPIIPPISCDSLYSHQTRTHISHSHSHRQCQSVTP